MSDQVDSGGGSADRALFLVVTIRPRLDRLAEAEAQLHRMRAASLTEEGCIFMHLVESPDEPDSWTMLEQFTSRTAWDTHMGTAHNRQGNLELEPLLREPSTLRLYTEK
jgi:quinol monooxygenase YgiN